LKNPRNATAGNYNEVEFVHQYIIELGIA